MKNVKGSTGYRSVLSGFVAATEAVAFEELHKPYLELIPREPSRILDVGAGVGRDASVLASMGHDVVAIEPTPEFLATAKRLHSATRVEWIDDSLPELSSLGSEAKPFDFVLASAVWHHLDQSERAIAMSRVAELVAAGGVFALSLRHGPPGAGTHTFPTDHQQTITSAIGSGFETLVSLTDLPSLIAGKSNVKWSKLAFRRV
ncbi:MAG: class I SAM-dependent methyltransferase [Pseudomonadota bacterium]